MDRYEPPMAGRSVCRKLPDWPSSPNDRSPAQPAKLPSEYPPRSESADPASDNRDTGNQSTGDRTMDCQTTETDVERFARMIEKIVPLQQQVVETRADECTDHDPGRNIEHKLRIEPTRCGDPACNADRNQQSRQDKIAYQRISSPKSEMATGSASFGKGEILTK